MARNASPLKHLQHLLNDTYFVDNWIDKYGFCEPNADIESQFALYQADVLSFSKVIFEYLTLSVLGGNYMSFVHLQYDHKDNVFINLQKNLTSKIEGLTLPCDNQDIIYRIQDYFLINIIKPYSSVIEKYQRFIFDLILYYDDYESIKIFQAYKSSSDLEPSDSYVLNLVKLFETSLSVAIKDHFLKFNNIAYSNLLMARENLKSCTADPNIKEALSQKINLLLLKLINRSNLNRQKGRVKYVYAFGLQNISLELNEFNEVKLFNSFAEKMELHYEINSNWLQIQKKAYNNIAGLASNLIEYHNSVKVYKDINKSEQQVRNLYDQFKAYLDRIFVPRLPLFDKHALNISSNYFFNNYVSIAVSVPRDFTFFKELIMETEILQNKTLIKNYFSYYKVCGAFNLFLRKQLSNEDLNVDTLKQQIEFQTSAIIELENNYHWSKERNLYAFQLTREESYCSSLLEYDGKNFSVFSANSFVLPLPYNDINETVNQIKGEFNNLKNLYDYRINSETLNRKIKDGLDEIKKSERKSTEILAIFSAVSLFAIGDIHIITSEMKQDVMNPFRFILAFGFGLSLFVFLIWLITRDNIRKVSSIQWLGFSVFLLATLFVLYYFFNEFSYHPSGA